MAEGLARPPDKMTWRSFKPRNRDSPRVDPSTWDGREALCVARLSPPRMEEGMWPCPAVGRLQQAVQPLSEHKRSLHFKIQIYSLPLRGL